MWRDQPNDEARDTEPINRQSFVYVEERKDPDKYLELEDLGAKAFGY